MADARELLAAATPRPWLQEENRPHEIGTELEVVGVMDSSQRVADAALIVAAVNEYEALLDIDEASRQLVRRDIPIEVIGLCEANLLAAHAQLDAVRSAK